MRTGQGVVPVLILLFSFTGCDKTSWLNEKLVRVHFSPAITVDQATVYATMHEAKINHYSLLRMTIREADSGGVVIDYVETKPGDMTYRRKDRDPSNDIDPDELAHRVANNFFKNQEFLAGRILQLDKELEHLENKIENYYTPQQGVTKQWYNTLQQHYYGLTLVDSTTYLKVARIETMVLRVKPFQFLKQRFPVSHLQSL